MDPLFQDVPREHPTDRRAQQLSKPALPGVLQLLHGQPCPGCGKMWLEEKLLAATSPSPNGRNCPWSSADSALAALHLPAALAPPPPGTGNISAAPSSQSHKECTAAEGFYLPAMSTKPQEKL